MTSLILPPDKTTDLILSENKITVSDRTARLLFVSNKIPPRNGFGIDISIKFNLYDGEIHIENFSLDDPSTIYTLMLIRRPSDPSSISRPDYFPSYKSLTPEQKWIYLHWLTNITQPIDIGYVFIYYYGLERHLLQGDFDSAFDEIILLRQTHSENASFDIYSRSALLNSALSKKRPDRLEQLYRLFKLERLSNVELILAYQLGYDLGVDGLMQLAPNLRNAKKRYIKSNPDKYKTILEQVLMEEFGKPYLPFGSAYSMSEIPKRKGVLFANASFPNEIRAPNLPSFLSHEPFTNEATRILNVAHEKTKLALAENRRKEQNSHKSSLSNC